VTDPDLPRPPGGWPGPVPPGTPGPAPTPSGTTYPGQPAGPRPKTGGRNLLTLVAVAVAVLALLLGGVATIVAVKASGDAKEARDLAAAAQAGTPVNPANPVQPNDDAPAPDPGPTTDTAAPEPIDPNATAAPVIDDRTTYTSRYDKEPMTVTSDGCASMEVDVDEPRSNVNDGSDLTFTGPCSSKTAAFELPQGVNASIAGSRDSTPADCATKIRQAPVGAQNKIPARKGTVICLTTSFLGAKERGDRWRIARIEITDVSSDSTTARLEAYAWDIG
jgi:hypothetical protein